MKWYDYPDPEGVLVVQVVVCVINSCLVSFWGLQTPDNQTQLGPE